MQQGIAPQQECLRPFPRKFFLLARNKPAGFGFRITTVPAGSFDHLTAARNIGCCCECKPVQATERDDETPDVLPRIDLRFVLSAT
jgi:hypothetical protein